MVVMWDKRRELPRADRRDLYSVEWSALGSVAALETLSVDSSDQCSGVLWVVHWDVKAADLTGQMWVAPTEPLWAA